MLGVKGSGTNLAVTHQVALPSRIVSELRDDGHYMDKEIIT